MAKEIKDEVRAEVDDWVSAGNRRPKLTAVIVGDDPASQTYVKNKMSAAKYTGEETKKNFREQKIDTAIMAPCA